MTTNFNEFHVESAFIMWLVREGYTHLSGTVLSEERETTRGTLLIPRIKEALKRLNPELPEAALDEAMRQIQRLESPSLLADNLAFHKMLTRGIQLSVRHDDGSVRGETVWLMDFDEPDNNDWLVVNQLTIVGPSNKTRRPDVILYVNGFPLVLIELKDFTNPAAKVKRAYQQIQTYKKDIPQLFVTNAVLVVSDGFETRVGSLTAGWERFGRWREIDGKTSPPEGTPSLEVLAQGLLERRRLLDYIRHFVLFETDDGIVKKIAAYHQYYAVNAAVEQTVAALKPHGSGKAGVVWHTQGSGKSISMVFYAGKLITHSATQNPTLVLITDRNDLDGQLFGQFYRSKQLLNTTPHQAESRDDLRDSLQVASGGVVFTTMQKFTRKRARKDKETGKIIEAGERHYPCLSKRGNIILIADEAHRTQYNFARGLADNLQRALPNATRIGFTGTPIEFEDRDTQIVFGEYIDTYTLSQAVQDQATVPIYYEARLARLDLPEDEKPFVDEEFEEIVEAEDSPTQEKLQRKWSEIEALISTPKRLKLIARDITDHWRRRTEIIRGKGMIVTISRRVAALLYRQITRLNPSWHDPDVTKGAIKVVMTVSSDDDKFLQPHNYTKSEHELIGKRLRDPSDLLQLVIVCDMWLTGFDAPPVHTMYIDKPIKGHNLMQAIARVNRVHKDKEGGLIVDYLGVASELKKAIEWYDRGKKQSERKSLPVDQALTLLKKHHDVVKAMYHGFSYDGFFLGDSDARLKAITGGGNHILGLKDGRKRYRENMAALNKAASIALHLESARGYRDDIAYFQAVQKSITKFSAAATADDTERLNAAIRQIVSRAIVPDDEVMDLLGLAGIARPDISILSEAFLDEVKVSEYPNLQMEAFNKLLSGEVRSISERNIVQGRRFSERLQEAVNKYQNRSLSAAEVIMELVALAREIRAAREQGAELGLNDNEVAFYDALASHSNARELMGEKKLVQIAREIVKKIRKSATLDWTQKESVRAALRLQIEFLLELYDYPPDQCEAATALVLQQAETSCADWGIKELEALPAADASPQPEPAEPDAEDDSSEEAPLAPPPMTSIWIETLECAEPALHPFIHAAYEAGLNAPEPDMDWIGDNERTDGTMLPLDWPEHRVAVLETADLPEEVQQEMSQRSWTIFTVSDSPERVINTMR